MEKVSGKVQRVILRKISNYSVLSNENSPQKIAMSRSKSTNQNYYIEDLNPDVIAVKNLEFIEEKFESKIKPILAQAKSDLQRKLDYGDIVEEKIFKRRRTKSIDNFESQKERTKYLKTYEDILRNTYNSIEEKMKKCINDREKLRKNMCLMKDEMKNYKLTLEKLSGVIFSTIKPSSIRTQSDKALYLSAKQNQKDQINKQKLELQQNLDIIHIEISRISMILSELDENTSFLRKELKLVRNELIHHYLTLLKEGKDTRSEGLSWILKILIELDCGIRKDMFPACLDETSIEVLIKIAQKNADLDRFYNSLAISKAIKKDKSRENNIQTRLQMLKSNLRVCKPIYRDNKIVWKQTSRDADKNLSNKNHITDTLVLESYIKNVKEEILSLKTQEVKRMTKECIKHGKNIKEMIELIVGLDDVDKFMVITVKEAKDIENLKESVSTFTFTSKLKPKFKSISIS